MYTLYRACKSWITGMLDVNSVKRKRSEKGLCALSARRTTRCADHIVVFSLGLQIFRANNYKSGPETVRIMMGF